MSRKFLLVGLCLLVAAGPAGAEQIRPLLTKENAQPELHRTEVGFEFRFEELGDFRESVIATDTNKTSYIPSLRYRPFEPLTLFATFPFIDNDPDIGSGGSGLGDITVGFELLAYEDVVVEHPWVMPHLEVVLDTGDTKDGTGRGESSVIVGLAIGSATHWAYNSRIDPIWHLIGDVRYEIFEDSENIASVAGSVIWDITEQFSALGSVRLSDEQFKDMNENPVLFLGGLSYRATEKLTMTVQGGGGKNTREDVVVSVKATHDL